VERVYFNPKLKSDRTYWSTRNSLFGNESYCDDGFANHRFSSYFAVLLFFFLIRTCTVNLVIAVVLIHSIAQLGSVTLIERDISIGIA
jgi:hypothetical protein